MRSLYGETTGQILKMKYKHTLTFLIQSFLTGSKKNTVFNQNWQRKRNQSKF